MRNANCGTSYGYHEGCRCDDCVSFWREYCKEHRRPKTVEEYETRYPDREHGTERSFTRGCRCASCEDAGRQKSKRQYQRRRELFREDPERYRHGSDSAYNLGCKCEECLSARRIKQRKKRFGLTRADFLSLVEIQDGCGICHKALDEHTGHIDHDHATDQVRGVLCSGCNTSLGKLGDTIEGLKRAIAYLESVEKRLDSAKIAL